MKIEKKKFMLIVLIIGIPLMMFSAILNVMSYRVMLVQSYVHACNLNTTGIVRKLDYAIDFGKSLDKFYGLDILLKNTKELSDDIVSIEIYDKNEKKIAGIGNTVKHSMQEIRDEEYKIEGDYIFSFVDFSHGQIVLTLDKSNIDVELIQYIKRVSIAVSLCILFVCCGALIVCTFRKRKVLTVKNLKVTCLLLLTTVQLCFGIYFTIYAINSYRDSVNMIEKSAANVAKNDINEVIDKGMRYSELSGVDTYLKNLCSDIPELSSIKIKKDNKAFDNSSHIYKIGVQNNKVTLYVGCSLNEKLVRDKIINKIIDIGIIIIVSLFMSLEIVNLITNHIAQKKDRKKEEIYLPGYRIFVFVSGLAFSLDCGFVSILSSKLYEKMDLSDSMSFLSGLPNTMYSLAVVSGLFICGTFISKFGIRRTLCVGIGMGIAGYILCSISINLPMFIVAKFIFGFCDGLVINTIRLVASSQKDSEMHNKILVIYLAAINLGVCCSVVIGGLVADAASYSTVFIVGALLGLICLFLVKFANFSNEKSENSISFLGAVKGLKIGKVFIYMIFLIIPIYIATLFVGYTFPLYGDEMGFSNSIVSGCLMINYLIIAYLTDPISDWVIHHISPQKSVICYVILQGISIGIFVISPGIITALIALILTSLWDCFGMVIIDSVLDNVKNTTTENNTLLQMIFGKIAMVIGPLIVTANIDKGAATATGTIVMLLFAGTLCYVILNIFMNRRKEMGD